MFNKSNENENAAAVNALDLAGDERVIDVGFDGGASFPPLFAACPDGRPGTSPPSFPRAGPEAHFDKSPPGSPS